MAAGGLLDEPGEPGTPGRLSRPQWPGGGTFALAAAGGKRMRSRVAVMCGLDAACGFEMRGRRSEGEAEEEEEEEEAEEGIKRWLPQAPTYREYRLRVSSCGKERPRSKDRDRDTSTLGTHKAHGRKGRSHRDDECPNRRRAHGRASR